MPPVAHTDLASPSTVRILLTGFGPFRNYTENPSWLAAKALHNKVIYMPAAGHEPAASTHAKVNDADHNNALPPQRAIHITAIEVPVTYQAVLTTIPLLYRRPPILPIDDPALPPPPPNGYDFVFHIGVAGYGPLRMEMLGHKLGYRMKDAEGQYAPLIGAPKEEQGHQKVPEMSEAERGEMERNLAAGASPVSRNSDALAARQTADPQAERGFGEGYEVFADELNTDIDVGSIVKHLKETGIAVHTSMDAGHYLCDFIYYCSLAESKRLAMQAEKEKEPIQPQYLRSDTPLKGTPVLFMHCGPVDQPLSTEEVTEAAKRTIVWVCQNHI